MAIEYRAAAHRRRPSRRRLVGLAAGASVAFFGVAAGAFIAYSAGQGAATRAAAGVDYAAPGLEIPRSDFELARDRYVAAVMRGDPPERFEPPAAIGLRPRVIIVFDDMGLDRAAFETVMALPGPLTLSFLPYAPSAPAMAAAARNAGHATMLHLPMEPDGPNDPGPNSLKSAMTGAAFLRALDWNLSRFDGYVAVNNHMGSRLTRHEASMKTVLAAVKARGAFFLDSKTTPYSVAREAGRAVGAAVYERDVFLDADAGPETVRRQLAQVERIAQETGHVVAICHPRPATLEVLGPWLTSAPSRGLQLATVEALPEIERAAASAVALSRTSADHAGRGL